MERRLQRLIHSTPVVATAIGVFVFVVVFFVRQQGYLQEWELKTYDLHLKSLPQKTLPASKVLIVRITEADLQRFLYPLSDELLADVLQKLTQFEPRAIGVDLFRDIPSDGRLALEQVVKQNPRIILIEKRLGEPVPAPEFLTRDEQIGFADLKQDASGVIRRALLMMWDENNKPYFSLGLRMALTYLADEGITLTPDPLNEMNVRLDEAVIKRFTSHDGGYQTADEGGYQFLMDYARGKRSFTSVTLADVVDGKITSGIIHNKVVLIGVSAASVQDWHETPFSSGRGQTGPINGVDMHAHMVDQLLRIYDSAKAFPKVMPQYAEIMLMLLAGLIGAGLGMGIRQALTLTVFALSGVILLVVAAHYLLSAGLWFPEVSVVLCFIAAFGISIGDVSQRERADRKLVMQLFGKYVAPEVAEALWLQREDFMEGGRPRPQRLTATVLISDLEEFTAPSSHMEPNRVMDWINAYMSAMTRIAAQHHGIVDDYAGDGLKVNFGVPIARTSESKIRTDAQNAVECAIAMAQESSRLNQSMHSQGLPKLRLRVGIHTGPVVAGSMGDSQRMKYTTVGDTVNTAARIESIQKEAFKKQTSTDSRILISETTRSKLTHGIATFDMGNHFLRGHDHDTHIYCVKSGLACKLSASDGMKNEKEVA